MRVVHCGPMMKFSLQVPFLAPSWPLSCAHNLQCYHYACCPLAQDHICTQMFLSWCWSAHAVRVAA